ncbi:FGGY-family carbohydrate kinase, partial [Roseiflexus sp.]
LALRYRQVIDALERLTGQSITTVRIVGGGSQNTLLCQLTADACHRPVVAGPTEGTALGNILVQAIAMGYLPDLATARQVVAASEPQRVYTPRAMVNWEGVFLPGFPDT